MYKSDNDHNSIAYLGFKIKKPPKELQTWLQCLWSAEASLAQEHRETWYPDGGNSLIAKPNQQSWYLDTNPSAPQSQTYFGDIQIFGVRFRPGILSILQHKPVTLIGTREELFQEVLSMKDFQSFETYILNRVWDKRRFTTESDLLMESMNVIAEKQDGLKQSELAKTLRTHPRKLERIFQSHIGVGPKTIQNMLRIGQARKMLKRNPELIISQLALELGFYDQSHFTRFFRKFVGMSPKKYAKRALLRSLTQNT